MKFIMRQNLIINLITAIICLGAIIYDYKNELYLFLFIMNLLLMIIDYKFLLWFLKKLKK